jgi:hypothetical protein
MQLNACALLACLSAGLVFAQGSSSSSSDSGKTNYVRRISAGLSLGVLVLPLIKNTTSTTTPNATTTNNYSTTGALQRIGFGGTVNAAILDRFAVNVSATYRRIGYQMTTGTTVTTTSTSTNTITYTTTSLHEDTRASALEVPVTLRWYSISRRKKGPRFFAEGGMAIRDLINARTSTDTTDASGTQSCCIATAARPAHRIARGYVAGVGVQVIDPIGVRVIPEVRYTRWANDTFNTFSTHTQRNELEAVISLTF